MSRPVRLGSINNTLYTVSDEPHDGGPGVMETTFIVQAIEDDPSKHPAYKAGDMFLCDRTGARRYIRMWAKLV